VCLAVILVSGCGRYKQELETAKQQVVNLAAENKKLTDLSASLNQEKGRLNDQIKDLSDKYAKAQRELDDANKAKTDLSNENSKLKQQDAAMKEEIASLKTERDDLSIEAKELKQRLSEALELAGPSLSVPARIALERSANQMAPDSRKTLSACDAVIEFMKRSESVIKRNKGQERAELLRQVKQQYSSLMRDAPERATKAAQDWVNEGPKFWDESSDNDSVFRLLQLRNIVLDACGKTPSKAGFD
jgi:chromosome segregation ATPase